MTPEDDLINFPWSRPTLKAVIQSTSSYRMPDTSWTLEVQDVFGNSTVWDGEFATDKAALDEFFRTIQEEGIASLIGEPSKRDLDAAMTRVASSKI